MTEQTTFSIADSEELLLTVEQQETEDNSPCPFAAAGLLLAVTETFDGMTRSANQLADMFTLAGSDFVPIADGLRAAALSVVNAATAARRLASEVVQEQDEDLAELVIDLLGSCDGCAAGETQGGEA